LSLASSLSRPPGPFITNFEQGVPTWGSIYQIAPAQMDVFQNQRFDDLFDCFP